ncbi:MAG: ankyrin repeat domain-containing protein [Rubrivivax sp.]|nr:ankyrin repeat domain-containing protein [Pyrinomonadaceae bacterium]
MQVQNNGISALMSAASRGDFQDFLHQLAEGGDVNARDIFGHTALTYAAMAGNERIVRALLMMGANADAENQIGLTPCKLAALLGHLHLKQLLVPTHEGALPDGPERVVAQNADGVWVTEAELEHCFVDWEQTIRH